MFESQEKYKREWARCADEAVCPAGWISVVNLAGVIGCSETSVRVHCAAAGLESRMVKRVTVDGRKLIGRMMVFPKEEALEVMYAWEEGRAARERRMVEKVERSEAAARRREERAAARREKEAAERKLIAERRAKVRAERKRMFQERKAELAREKERRKKERVRERRRVARERVRAGSARAK